MKKICIVRRREGVVIERTVNGVPQPEPPSGLGDKIAAIATPIARVLRLPCIDPETKDPRPGSGCAKMKKRLNEGMPLRDAVKKRIKGE